MYHPYCNFSAVSAPDTNNEFEVSDRAHLAVWFDETRQRLLTSVTSLLTFALISYHIIFMTDASQQKPKVEVFESCFFVCLMKSNVNYLTPEFGVKDTLTQTNLNFKSSDWTYLLLEYLFQRLHVDNRCFSYLFFCSYWFISAYSKFISILHKS